MDRDHSRELIGEIKKLSGKVTELITLIYQQGCHHSETQSKDGVFTCTICRKELR